MRFQWLVTGILGVFLLALPAEAGKLQTWKFDTNRNRLDFTTDEGVQPRAQLIPDPTRLVLDLPGVKLDRPTTTQTYRGAIRSIRLGQFDSDTARIVIELAPGYTLDPQQIRVRGSAANQWSVQLPQPRYVGLSTPGTTASSPPDNPGEVANNANVQIQGVQVTPDGLFVRTSDRVPSASVERSPDGSQVQLVLPGTTISPTLARRDFVVNRYGIQRVQVTQPRRNPPETRVTLFVQNNSPDWQASISSLGGVVLVPREPLVGRTSPPFTPPNRVNPPTVGSVATIEAVSLEGNGTQLVIRSDQSVQYSAGWDRNTGLYRVTLSPARLADRVTGPRLTPNSSIQRVRLRQEDQRTVAILLQPSPGVQIGPLSQVNNQLVALQLIRRSTPNLPPISNTPPPTQTRPPTQTPISLGRPPQRLGRVVVVIDPGHGGPDPGAIGIGGLQEKGIVLDIGQQVVALLQQQGIQAVITRPDDRDLDLEPRVSMAQQVGADLFVSIHANSINLSRQDISGIETYYYGSGERLARVIHSSIIQATGAKDRGVRRARFYVLRKTSMPSVLIEVGFVTGAEDAARLRTPAYRSQMAAAITRGIIQYLSTGR